MKNAETKSKYNTRFRYYKETASKEISSAKLSIVFDTIIGKNRLIELEILPTRKINKLEFITHKKLEISQFKVNDALINEGKNYGVEKGTFLIYYLANSDKKVSVSFSIHKNKEIDIILNEISFDLLTNTAFSIKPRSANMMPMPFVTNDAIIISKKINL